MSFLLIKNKNGEINFGDAIGSIGAFGYELADSIKLYHKFEAYSETGAFRPGYEFHSEILKIQFTCACYIRSHYLIATNNWKHLRQ